MTSVPSSGSVSPSATSGSVTPSFQTSQTSGMPSPSVSASGSSLIDMLVSGSSQYGMSAVKSPSESMQSGFSFWLTSQSSM